MPGPIRAAQIDGSFVPSGASTVTAVELDGEGLLYDEARQHLHVLNPSATAVWACCDGSQTVDELVAELAEAFGAPPETIGPGALMAVRDFGARGLLVGVEAEESADALADSGTPRSAPHFLEEPPST